MRDTRVLSSSSLRNTASSLLPKRVVSTFDPKVTTASMTAVRRENDADTRAVLSSLAVGIARRLGLVVTPEPAARGVDVHAPEPGRPRDHMLAVDTTARLAFARRRT